MCEACAEDTKDCMLGYIGGGGQLQLTLQVMVTHLGAGLLSLPTTSFELYRAH
ncbi:hypothetical protein PC129_g23911 [Phytophthora cactorum]|uniref:Uncharacterized protein n=1 Tax=Phytophthora cactorum TaxID=29920 RepID=A0A329RIE2_9STRA|nr:hypothetical protein PC129_g23911 [Phytophthora cactorum]RAW23102.1 hypothetical protein PC110_g20462 [Phytophthora cactorum]